MKAKLRIIVWLWLVVIVAAGSTTRAQDYERYVDANNMPNPVVYLPPPPDSTMIMLNGDYARWIWGKKQRSTPRGEEASGDSKFGIIRMSAIYGPILGLDISEASTPAIYRFMARAGATGAGGVSAMKHACFRRRPFLVMNELPWGAHDSYDDLADNSSYPSSHTACGWGTALALAEVAPHLQDTILRRGYDYGISRVITGAHWQSDVHAAYLCASAAISRARLTSDYQADLRAAQQEYMQLKGIDELERNPQLAPSALKILDPPVMDDSYFYYGEVATYWLAKQQRGTARGSQAVADANLSDDAIVANFATCLDIDVSAASTPHIVALIKNYKLMLDNHATAMKGLWFRPRPFVQFADGTMLPEQEQACRNESSYPSRHAMVGWGLALALAEAIPGCQNAILKRGYDIGWSRVIVGYNYPGDVQAGWLMAASLIAEMHNEVDFGSMIEAARQEYDDIKSQGGTVATSSIAQHESVLPLPPDSTGTGFAGDFYRWIWGKHQRSTELGEQASHDDGCGIDRLCEIFGDAMGMNIGQEAAPAIYDLLNNAVQVGLSSAQELNVNERRKRPFVLMNEQPWGISTALQQELGTLASHPSDHATMTWSAALALAQLAPNHQDSILARAKQCAGSGVITGTTWQSDVDAAMISAGWANAKLWADAGHAALFEAARSEYLQLTGLTSADLNVPYPSIAELIGAVPTVDSIGMAGDLEAYWHSKPLRSTERGELAQADASLSNEYFATIFDACSPRVEINQHSTPRICNLINYLKFCLNSQATLLKSSMPHRNRPFRQYNESFPYGGQQWQLFTDPSYPSRHAMVGWGLAMVLSEVMPDCRNALFKRGYDYGESRIIMGLAYASDVQAARVMAQYYLNRLRNEQVYKMLIDEAKREYRQLSFAGDVNGDGKVTSVDITALYNHLLNSDSSAIVCGDQDGDGRITAADVTVVYNILLGN